MLMFYDLVVSCPSSVAINNFNGSGYFLLWFLYYNPLFFMLVRIENFNKSFLTYQKKREVKISITLKVFPYISCLQLVMFFFSYFFFWPRIIYIPSLISLQWPNSQLRSSIYLQFYTKR